MNYWERWIGDWKRKTAHLSAEAKGIYGELLDHEYATHQPLPLDPEEVYRIAGARTPSECKNTDKILAAFYTRTDSGYINPRAQDEIEKRAKYVETKRSNANARWHKDVNMETGEVKPPKPPRKVNGHPAMDMLFFKFWEAYPRKVGKGPAEKAWAKIKMSPDMVMQIMQAVETQRTCEQWLKEGGSFIPHPATWLNQRRWEDQGVTLDFGRCNYCAEPATGMLNGIGHCARGQHIDWATKGTK